MNGIKVLSFLTLALLFVSFFIVLNDYDNEKLEVDNKTVVYSLKRAVLISKTDKQQLDKSLKKDNSLLGEWYFKAYELYKNHKYLQSYNVIKSNIVKNGDLKNAQKAFIDIIKKDEKEFIAYEFLAYLYLFSNEYDNSLIILQQAKEKSNNEKYYLTKMLLVDFLKLFEHKINNLQAIRDEFSIYYFSLYKLYLFDEAIEFFKTLRESQRDEDFLKEILKFHIDKNDYNQAIRFLEELGLVDSKFYNILQSLKTLMEDISYGNFDDKKLNETISIFDKLNGIISNSKIVEIAKTIIAKNPDNSYGHIFLSFAQIYDKDIDGAIKSSKKSIELNSKEGINYLLLTLLYISKNDFIKAEDTYKRILKNEVIFEKEFDEQKAIDTIMKYFFSKKEYDKVLDYYINLENKKLISKKAIDLVSKIYLKKREFKNAIDFVKQTDGSDTFLLNKIKDDIKFIKYYENEIEINPTNSNLYLTYLSKNLNSKQDGIHLFEKAISYNPNDAILYSNYADYLTKTNLEEITVDKIFLDDTPYKYFDEKKVVSLYKKAIELEPNNDSHYNKLAHIYYRKKKFKEAEKYYELSKELNPNPKINEMLLDIYLENEEFDKIERLNMPKELEDELREINIAQKGSAKYYYNLTLFFYKKNRLPQTLKNYKKAKQLNSNILIILD